MCANANRFRIIAGLGLTVAILLSAGGCPLEATPPTDGQPPVAGADPDQSVRAGDVARFDAGESADDEGGASRPGSGASQTALLGAGPASISITSPSHGQFSTAGSVLVEGAVESVDLSSASVTINGTAMTLDDDGHFSTTVVLSPDAVFNPILAELDVGDGQPVLRDRVVVIAGDSISAGSAIDDGVVVRLSERGLSAIQAEVDQQLIDQGVLDIWALVADLSWFDAGDLGPFGYYLSVVPSGAGFGCHAIEFDPQPGKTHVTLTLYDVFVNYHAVGGVSASFIDIDVDCAGTVAADLIRVDVDLGYAPSASGVDVTQLGPADVQFFDLRHFFTGGVCDEEVIDDILYALVPPLQPMLEPGLEALLNNPLPGTDDPPLAELLEQQLAGLDFDGPLEHALSMTLSNTLDRIAIDEEGISVVFDTAVTADAPHPDAPSLSASYHVPAAAPSFGPATPDAALPYAVGLATSTSLFNQLLAAATRNGLLITDLAELDPGSGPVPLTVGLLALLAPDLEVTDPDAPLLLRLRPTLAPVLTESPGPGGALGEILLSQLTLEAVAEPGAADEVLFFRAALDCQLGLNLWFDDASGSLQAALIAPAPEDLSVVLIDNPFGLDDTIASTLLAAMMPALWPQLASTLGAFPLPSFAGMSFEGTETAHLGGYVANYLDLDPAHGRPDLIVSIISVPEAVDRGSGFRIDFVIANIGTAPAGGFVDVGASLSIDDYMFTLDDIPLGQLPYDLGALAPGETRSYSMFTMPFPTATMAAQNVFVCVDNPPLPFGFPSAGTVCESVEQNNCSVATTLVSAPDAWVDSFEVPEGLISVPLPGQYTVTVCRDDVGPDQLNVPAGVSVGAPPIFFGEEWTTLGRGECRTLEVYVGTPAVMETCGDSASFPVLACALLLDDGDPSNNCMADTVEVTGAYWDLVYELDAPDVGIMGEPVLWDVIVTNVGNITAPPTASRTGICASPGLDYTTCIASPFQFMTPALSPNESYVHQLALTPLMGALPNQFVKAGIDPFGGGSDICAYGNQVDHPITITVPEIAVVDVGAPASAVSGDLFFVEFMVANDGGPGVDVPVTVTIGTNSCTTAVYVPAFGTATGACQIMAPPSFLDCGGPQSFTVTACASYEDIHPENNCGSTSMAVEDAFWDLRFEIIGAPAVGYRGSSVTWQIRVTNVGNVLTSENVCAFSGIGLYSGPGAWASCLEFRYFLVPPLVPGGTWTCSVGSYGIPWGALPTTQYIKAEINYAAGCYDQCTFGNYDEVPIQIY